MDPVSVKAAETFAERFGFAAVLVVVLMAGVWWLIRRYDSRMDDKDKLHREERGEHLTALREITGQWKVSTDALATKVEAVHDEVRELRRDTTPRFRNGTDG